MADAEGSGLPGQSVSHRASHVKLTSEARSLMEATLSPLRRYYAPLADVYFCLCLELEEGERRNWVADLSLTIAPLREQEQWIWYSIDTTVFDKIVAIDETSPLMFKRRQEEIFRNVFSNPHCGIYAPLLALDRSQTIRQLDKPQLTVANGRFYLTPGAHDFSLTRLDLGTVDDCDRDGLRAHATS